MAGAKTMLDKLNEAAPYNIFYNQVPELPDPEDSNAITFTDFLCPSLGKLKCSLHIAAKVDIQWLIRQYETMKAETKPLTVLYLKIEGKMIQKVHFPNVTLQSIGEEEEAGKLDFFSSHHEKLSIFVYEDNSLRVVISTCNLRDQWERFNHGFWMSPPCPPLDAAATAAAGESPTNFKSDLLAFLNQYRLPVLDEWIDHVTNADFGDVRAFLITSIPGRYQPHQRGGPLQQVHDVIKKHCRLTPKEESLWPLIAQASNMGQFGESPHIWLRSYFLNHLASPNAELKIVFPTWKQVKNGHFDPEVVGEGLRYSRAVHNRQKWLQDYLYQWKADAVGRSKVLPHMKTYCRVSPCWTKMAWFLITTSNVNKGAWGQPYFEKGGPKTEDVFVRNCEIGVMLVPKLFDEEYFRVKGDVGERVFPLIYDLPLKKYTEKEYPWTLSTTQRRF